MAEKLDDICETHNTPMIKQKEHIGDGNWQWSKPFCPLCKQIEEAKPAQAAEKPPATPVAKADAGTIAAKP